MISMEEFNRVRQRRLASETSTDPRVDVANYDFSIQPEPIVNPPPEILRQQEIERIKREQGEEVAKAEQSGDARKKGGILTDTIESFKSRTRMNDLEAGIAEQLVVGNTERAKELVGIRKKILEIEARNQEFNDAGFLGSLADTVGYMWDGFVSSQKTGLATGLASGAAGLAGGPLAGLTFAGGYSAGASAGMFARFAAQGAGMIYADLIDEGISEKNAAVVSIPAGIVYGAVEQLTRFLPKPLQQSVERLVPFKTFIRRKVMESALRVGGRYVAQVAGESGEEGAQAMVQDIARNTAIDFQNGLDEEGNPLAKITGSDIFKNALDEAIAAIPTTMVLGGIGAASDTRQVKAAIKDAKAIEKELGLTETQALQKFEEVKRQAESGTITDAEGKPITDPMKAYQRQLEQERTQRLELKAQTDEKARLELEKLQSEKESKFILDVRNLAQDKTLTTEAYAQKLEELAKTFNEERKFTPDEKQTHLESLFSEEVLNESEVKTALKLKATEEAVNTIKSKLATISPEQQAAKPEVFSAYRSQVINEAVEKAKVFGVKRKDIQDVINGRKTAQELEKELQESINPVAKSPVEAKPAEEKPVEQKVEVPQKKTETTEQPNITKETLPAAVTDLSKLEEQANPQGQTVSRAVPASKELDELTRREKPILDKIIAGEDITDADQAELDAVQTRKAEILGEAKATTQEMKDAGLVKETAVEPKQDASVAETKKTVIIPVSGKDVSYEEGEGVTDDSGNTGVIKLGTTKDGMEQAFVVNKDGDTIGYVRGGRKWKTVSMIEQERAEEESIIERMKNADQEPKLAVLFPIEDETKTISPVSKALGINSITKTRELLRRAGYTAPDTGATFSRGGTYSAAKASASGVTKSSDGATVDSVKEGVTAETPADAVEKADAIDALIQWKRLKEKKNPTNAERVKMSGLLDAVFEMKDKLDLARLNTATIPELEIMRDSILGKDVKVDKPKEGTVKADPFSEMQSEALIDARKERNAQLFTLKEKGWENISDDEKELARRLSSEVVQITEMLDKIGKRFQTSITSGKPATRENVDSYGREVAKDAGGVWTPVRNQGDIVGILRIGTKSVAFRLSNAGVTNKGERAAGFVRTGTAGDYSITIDPVTGNMTTPRHEVGHIVFDSLTNGQKAVLERTLGFKIGDIASEERFVRENLETDEARADLADKILTLTPDDRNVVVRALNMVIRGINAVLGTDFKPFNIGAGVGRLTAEELSEGLKNLSILKQSVGDGQAYQRNQTDFISESEWLELRARSDRDQDWSVFVSSNKVLDDVLRYAMDAIDAKLLPNTEELRKALSNQAKQLSFNISKISGSDIAIAQIKSATGFDVNQFVQELGTGLASTISANNANGLIGLARGGNKRDFYSGKKLTDKEVSEKFGVEKSAGQALEYKPMSQRFNRQSNDIRFQQAEVKEPTWSEFYRDNFKNEWYTEDGKAFKRDYAAREDKSISRPQFYNTWKVGRQIQNKDTARQVEREVLNRRMKNGQPLTPIAIQEQKKSNLSRFRAGVRGVIQQNFLSIRPIARMISPTLGDLIERGTKRHAIKNTMHVNVNRIFAETIAPEGKNEKEKSAKVEALFDRFREAPTIESDVGGLFIIPRRFTKAEYYNMIRNLMDKDGRRALFNGAVIGSTTEELDVSMPYEEYDAKAQAFARSELARDPDMKMMFEAENKVTDYLFDKANEVYKKIVPKENWHSPDGMIKAEYYTAMMRERDTNTSGKQRNNIIRVLNELSSTKKREGGDAKLVIQDGLLSLGRTIENASQFTAYAEFTTMMRKLLKSRWDADESEANDLGKTIIKHFGKGTFDNLMEGIDQLDGKAYNVNDQNAKTIEKVMRNLAIARLSGPTTVAKQPVALMIPFLKYSPDQVMRGYNNKITWAEMEKMLSEEPMGGSVLLRMRDAVPVDEARQPSLSGADTIAGQRANKFMRAVHNYALLGTKIVDQMTVAAHGRVAWQSVNERMPNATYEQKREAFAEEFNDLLEYQMIGDPSMRVLNHNKGGFHAALNMFRSTVNAQAMKVIENYMKAKDSGNKQAQQEFFRHVVTSAIGSVIFLNAVDTASDWGRTAIAEMMGDDDDKKEIAKRRESNDAVKLQVLTKRFIDGLAGQLPITNIGTTAVDLLTEMTVTRRKDLLNYKTQNANVLSTSAYGSVAKPVLRLTSAINKHIEFVAKNGDGPYTKEQRKALRRINREEMKGALGVMSFTPASSPAEIWSNFLSLDKALFRVE